MINHIRRKLEATTRHLPLKTKIIFGWGDFFGGASINTISFFYLLFLTDIVGIPPALAGAAIMISKIWDAVTDPLMGMITDRTRTRWGKRRPYFFLAIFTVFAGWVLLWNPVAFESLKLRFAYVLFSYLFFNTVSTMVLVPYIASQPLLTPDYDERTVLNLVRMVFSFGGTIIGALLPILVLRYAADIRMGYRIIALFMGFLFALPWVAISLHIKEPDNRNDPPAPPFRWGDFLAPLRIRTFRYMIGIYLCSLLAMDIVTALAAYFVIYVRSAPFPDLRIIVGVTGFICILVFPYSTRLAHKFGKERVFIISALLFIIGMAGFTFLDGVIGLFPSFLITIPGTLGVLGCTIFPWTMFPDAADVGKLAWGYSRAGSFGGLMTLFRKLSSAFAIFLVGSILSRAGYINPGQTNVLGVLTLERVPQPPLVILTIRLLIFVLPTLILITGMILAWRYPLKARIYQALSRHLESRAKGVPAEAGQPATEGEPAEAERPEIEGEDFPLTPAGEEALKQFLI